MRIFPFLVGTLVVLASGYLLLVGLLYWRQDRMLFPATPVRTSPEAAGLGDLVREIALRTPDGETLLGWWRPPEPGRALLVYLHGNGGSLLNRAERARALLRDGRGLLLVSYRGYSGSTGTPSEAGLLVDADTIYRFASSYAPARLVLYGESLGSGVAVDLASRRPVGGVILDAPFTSVTDVAQRLFPWLPVAPLLRTRFRSVDRVAAIGAPLLILHGEKDALIPIDLGERLFVAASEPKRFVRLPDADHVSVLEHGGLATVRAFLDEVEARIASGRPEAPAVPLSP